MSLTAAAIRMMAEKGFTAQDIADVAEAMEKPVPSYDMREAKRTYDRERMRRKREVARQSHDSRSDTGPSPKNFSDPSCNSENNQTPTPPKTPLTGVKKVPATKRCPVGWSPSPATVGRLEAEGYSPGELERALNMIRDHQFRSALTDWDAAYRNWVRRNPPRKAHERPDTDPKYAAKQANLARAFAAAGSAARRSWEP